MSGRRGQVPSESATGVSGAEFGGETAVHTVVVELFLHRVMLNLPALVIVVRMCLWCIVGFRSNDAHEVWVPVPRRLWKNANLLCDPQGQRLVALIKRTTV